MLKKFEGKGGERGETPECLSRLAKSMSGVVVVVIGSLPFYWYAVGVCESVFELS